MITQEIKEKILSVVRVFETGNSTPQYDSVTILVDGKVNNQGLFDSDGEIYIKQATYGESQTTEQYLLKNLLQMYIDADGIYSDDFVPYMKNLSIIPLEKQGKLTNFCALLKLAGNDPKMKKCQELFFDKYYYTPAFDFFKSNNFTLPLSLLVAYDSHIQSGRVADFLRARFSETPPALGGREKEWVIAYLNVRKQWLSTHKNAAVRRSVYRANALIEQAKADNWDLSQPIKSNGVIV